MTHLDAGSATDVGLVRANNQDQMLLASTIFAVADGMGGHAAGEVASRIAVDSFRAAFEAAAPSADGVLEAAHAANRSVWDAAQAEADLRGMGTTLTAMALVPGRGADQVAIVNIGDSRTYQLRQGRLNQITVDHSYVAELVAEGRIDEEEAEVHPQRHVLTRALGISPDVEIDLLVRAALPGDRYLLCSDGLSREVTDAQVASTLQRLSDPGEAARELVAAAKRHGGSDNITVVVVDVVADDPRSAGADAVQDAPARPAAADHAGGSATPSDDADPATTLLAAVDPGSADRSNPSGTVLAEQTSVTTTATESADNGPAPGDRPADTLASTTAPGDQAGGTTAPGDHPGGSDSQEGSTGEPGSAVRTRRARRQAARTQREPRARLLTIRVVGFVLLLVAIIGVAAFGTEYYARSTYYVGLRDGKVIIFKGRPGGVLWWKPTISQRTTLTTSAVLSYNLSALRSGVQESSLTTAKAYVTNLAAEKAADTPTTTAPVATTPVATTTAPTTTAPTTSAPTTTAKSPAAGHHHRTKTPAAA